MDKPTPSGETNPDSGVAQGRLQRRSAPCFILGCKGNSFGEAPLQIIIHRIFPAGGDAREDPDGCSDPRLDLKGSHLNELFHSCCRALCPPSPRQRCLHSGLCRELLAREHLPISRFCWILPLHVVPATFFLPVLCVPWEGAAAMQLHGAAGGFLPQPAPSWSCCGIPSQQFTKIPSWRESRGCTSSSAWRNLHNPTLWAPLHKLPKMGIKEPRRGIYFLPKTILKITNTSKRVTCGASV